MPSADDTIPVRPNEISPRWRVVVLCVATAMTLHFAMATAMWGCVVLVRLRSPGAHGWDWLPQALAAWALLVLFVWSAWAAWRWQRRSFRLLLAGVVLTAMLVSLERHFSLYQIGVMHADRGCYSVYHNSFEFPGKRDRF